MKHNLIIVLFILAGIVCHANDNDSYKIEVKCESLKDSALYLAHYYDSKIYVNDTVHLNAKGEGVFSKPKTLNQGLYVIYKDGSNYFDFLIGNDLSMKVTIGDGVFGSNIEIEGADESVRFLKYQQHLKAMNEKRAGLNEQLKAAEDKTAINEQLKELYISMEKYVEDEKNSLPGSMYSLFLNAVAPAPIFEPTVDKTNPKYDSIFWHQQYNFRVKHHFDGIDFSDDRILYTPLLKSRLDAFFNQVLLQIPDTITKHGLEMINSAKGNEIMYEYTSRYMLNIGLQSKIMGMDAVFVNTATHTNVEMWADSASLKTIKEEVFFLRNNQIGKFAMPLDITDIEDHPFRLYDVNADYIILVFWEPECGHCKKEVPALYETYMKFVGKNIEVVAVYTGSNDEKDEWKKFVDEHELVGWHHVYDPENKSRFRYNYNVRSTPQIYLIDKNKKIVAKRLDHESMGKLLENILDNQ